MSIKDKDFVEIGFTGRIKNGEVFDSNIKEDLEKLKATWSYLSGYIPMLIKVGREKDFPKDHLKQVSDILHEAVSKIASLR